MCLISKRPRAFGRRTMLYFSLHPQHRSQCLTQKRQLNLVSWTTQVTGNVFDIWVSGYRAIASDYICLFATATAKSLQSCLTLCDTIDGSPPGSPVPGILQARILEWVAISFSNAWKWKMKMKLLSHVWLLVTPRTAAHQAFPSMGFSRQEYWSGVPLPSLICLFRLYLITLINGLIFSFKCYFWVFLSPSIKKGKW